MGVLDEKIEGFLPGVLGEPRIDGDVAAEKDLDGGAQIADDARERTVKPRTMPRWRTMRNP